jgi:hypothetical protein
MVLSFWGIAEVRLVFRSTALDDALITTTVWLEREKEKELPL